MTSAIRLDHVTKKIEGREVLNNVTLSIEQGKIVGFVGHNGSGKSMLFRMIAGLVKPSAGEISVFGDRLHKDISFPRNMGVILEKPGLLEQYSGFDNLKFLADIQRKINDEQMKSAIVGYRASDYGGTRSDVTGRAHERFGRGIRTNCI